MSGHANNNDIKGTTFRLPANRLKTLRHLAIEEGISMSKAVEQAVDVWISDRLSKPPAQRNGEGDGQ